ncbi:hypothetical protein [Sulfurimonas paralvinellae]|uniref:NarX-like N-terminal domain-containing protein n=1 Tax=Sulfurimonas paralvinellae TaxID=317658 RepID=A0A7M1BA82_9BACT|nr:hypothetical protein [Sulfurimonas paralvinellae]QOP46531.1 hypothetical protein FM071_09575 [Sulfurimonas paralvinellae]
MNKIKTLSAFIFILSLILALYSKHVSEENDANLLLLKTINEQKAFTQEIAKNIFYIYNNKHASTKQLDASIKSFVQNVNSKEERLKDLDNKDIRQQIQKIIALWNKFYLLVQKFRDVSKVHNGYTNIIQEKLVNDIYNANLDLVVAFDKLIAMHKEYFDTVKKQNRVIQITLFISLLLLLVYFFTQLKDILGFIQKFLHTSKKIIHKSSVQGVKPIDTETNNKDISTAANDFNFLIQKINNSIETSETSLQQSIGSLENIEKNIEDLIELIAAMQTDKSFDKELIKKEDILIETLDELSLSLQKLQNLKENLNNFKK